ncbi:MAG: hypothetical protein V4617_15905 [Gemmatimonadota bacterium]
MPRSGSRSFGAVALLSLLLGGCLGEPKPRRFAIVHPFFAGHWRGSLDSGGTWLLMLDSSGEGATSIKSRPRADPPRVDSAIARFDAWRIEYVEGSDSASATLLLLRNRGQPVPYEINASDSVTSHVNGVRMTRLTRRVGGTPRWPTL